MNFELYCKCMELMAKGMDSIETYKELIKLGYSKEEVEQLLGFEIVDKI